MSYDNYGHFGDSDLEWLTLKPSLQSWLPAQDLTRLNNNPPDSTNVLDTMNTDVFRNWGKNY